MSKHDRHSHSHPHSHSQIHERWIEQAAPSTSNPDVHDLYDPLPESIPGGYTSMLRGVYGAINAELRDAIIVRDVLGLRSQNTSYASTQPYAPPVDNEQYTSSPFDPTPIRDHSAQFRAAKQRGIVDWIDRQQVRGIINAPGISERENEYIRRAWAAGVRHAHRDLRLAGIDPLRSDAGDDSNPFEQLALGFGLSVSGTREKLSHLFERNVEALRGISNDVSKEVSRVLGDGLRAGDSPTAIADNLTDRVDSVGKANAYHMAEYESAIAYNEGTLDTLEDSAIELVDILNGPDPCLTCVTFPLDNPYRIEDARAIIPEHPHCYCTMSPVRIT